MMCSDGLSDMVRDQPIADIMLSDATLAQKATLLISAANAAGGRDNISVVITHAKEATVKRGFLSRMLGK
jgi:protein phosphatase